ncbi:MAG: potassium-transporting ATPase subunit KdpC [Candidatus Kapabacteria bacterium]|nr:potassium-transporting ATPase subunit KdpC [Candidatus Kapabacteria bacterium]
MKTTITALKAFILLTIICGVIYPLTITGIAQITFPSKANGSMIYQNNQIIGSELIGQQFSKPEFFWGRPSSINNNPNSSGASNLGPTGKAFKAQFNARVDTIRKYHGKIEVNTIPKDLLFASGSGVDPEISPEAAFFQVERIAKARKYTTDQMNKLKDIVKSSIEAPDFQVFGEERVNVLLLNLRLKGL